MAIEKIVIQLEVDDKDLKPTIKELEKLGAVSKKNASEFTKANKEFSTSAQSTAKSVNFLGSSIQGALTFTAVAAGVTKAIQTFKQFEKALLELSAITGATGKDLDFLANKAKEIGATSTVSATQALKAFTLIGSAKPELLKAKEALADVAKSAVTLAEASGMELPEAADSLTAVMNQFNLVASESERVINALAAGSKEGAAAIPDIKDAIQAFGVQANSANVSVEESIALVETLAEKGIKGAEAGTKLRNVLTIINTAGALPKEALDQLEAFGVNIETVTNKALPLNERLQEFSKISGDATALVKVFGRENAVAGEVILKNTKGFEEYTKAITDTNVAHEQAEVQARSLEAISKKLENSLENLLIEAVTPLALGFYDLANASNSALSKMKYNNDELIGLYEQLKSEFVDTNDIAGSLAKVEKELAKADKELKENLNSTSTAVKNQGNLFESTRGEADALNNAMIAYQLGLEESEKAQEETGKTAEELKDRWHALVSIAAELKAQLEAQNKEKEDVIDNDRKEIKEKGKLTGVYETLAGITSRILQAQSELAKELAKPVWQQNQARIIEWNDAIESGKSEIEELTEATKIFQDQFKEIAEDPSIVNFGFTFSEQIEIASRSVMKYIDAINQIQDITNQIIDLNQIKYENELIQSDEKRERDLEEAERRISNERDLADAQARIEKEAEDRRKKILRDQARSEKNQAIFNAIINGGVGATKTIAQLGLPAALPFLALTAIQTALQVATIKAQPLPAYAKGTKSATGGLSLVSEEGQELMYHNGKAYLTPSTPSLIDVPQGAQIFTALQTQKMLETMDLRPLPVKKEKGFDYRLMGKYISREAGKQLIVNMDENGFTKHIITKSSRNSVLNSKLNFR